MIMSQQTIRPPVAKQIPHIQYFGNVEEENRGTGDLIDPPVVLIDDYHWMRSDDRKNPEVLQHIAEENLYTDHVMKPHAELKNTIYNELLSNMQEEYQTYPIYEHSNSKYRYMKKYLASVPYPIFCRFDESSPDDVTILLDQNELASGHDQCSVSGKSTNWDETLYSYGVDYEGNEHYTLRIINIVTKEVVTEIPNLMYCDYSWAGTDRLYLIRADDNGRMYALYYYELSTKTEQLIYQENNIDMNINMHISSDHQYLIVTSGNYDYQSVYQINLSDKNNVMTQICYEIKDVQYNVNHSGDWFYVHTNLNAHNWCVMRFKTNMNDCEIFLPVRSDIYLESIALTNLLMIIEIKINGGKMVMVMDYLKNYVKILNYPTIQSYSYDEFVKINMTDYIPDMQIITLYNSLYHSNTLIMEYDIMTSPTILLEINMDHNMWKLAYQHPVPNYDPSLYICERKWIPIKHPDPIIQKESRLKWPLGIPVSIIRLKETQINSTTPLYLYAYGAYGITIEPTFTQKIIPLLTRGWVYCIAHVRGGGYMGHEWYEDGRLNRKMNTFYDLHTVAEYFKNNGLCGNITCEGRSAGGLTAGTMITMYPNMFKTVVPIVPFVDCLNTMADSSIPLTVDEWSQWGNPNKYDDYIYISRYSPYDNVDKVSYPNIWIGCGLNDPRVAYWEPLKFISKLRHNKTDQNEQVIRIHGTGHFGGSSRYKHLEEDAEIYTFVLTR